MKRKWKPGPKHPWRAGFAPKGPKPAPKVCPRPGCGRTHWRQDGAEVCTECERKGTST
jgi:hypothetical protein